MGVRQPCVQAPAASCPSHTHCSVSASCDVTWHVQKQPDEFFDRKSERDRLRAVLDKPPSRIVVRRLPGLHAARLLPVLSTMAHPFTLQGAKPTAQHS